MTPAGPKQKLLRGVRGWIFGPMFRRIVSLAYLISGTGMLVILVALFLAVLVSGTLSDVSVSLTSWQGILLLGGVALLLIPLPIVWAGLFTLRCAQCRTSLFEPWLVPLRAPLSWLPGGRPMEISWRYLRGQHHCLKCGAPL